MKSANNQRMAFSLGDTAEILGISLRNVHTLIATKKLRSVKIGRRRLVTMEAIRELLEQAAA